MRVILQIGYSKALGRRKEGQLLNAWINDFQCEIDPDCGKYITTPVDGKRGFSWFLYDSQVEKTDTIRIECKTAFPGMGKDEDRTFELLYYLDENAPVREISIKGVGHSKYPLIKGRVIEIGSVSEKDKRLSDLDQFISEGF